MAPLQSLQVYANWAFRSILWRLTQIVFAVASYNGLGLSGLSGLLPRQKRKSIAQNKFAFSLLGASLWTLIAT